MPRCTGFFSQLATISEISFDLVQTLQKKSLKSFTYQNYHVSKMMTGLNRIGLIFCEKDGPTWHKNRCNTGKLVSKHSSWLCSNFVRLREKTLLREVAPLFQFFNTSLDVILRTVKPPINSKLCGVISTRVPSSPRVPDFKEIDNPWISSSITFGNVQFNEASTTDSSMNSKEAVSPQKPMNLTMEFP